MKTRITSEYDEILTEVGTMDFADQLLFAHVLAGSGVRAALRVILLQMGATFLWAALGDGAPPELPVPERIRALARRIETLALKQVTLAGAA